MKTETKFQKIYLNITKQYGIPFPLQRENVKSEVVNVSDRLTVI
jgi:hypothetical protein